MARGAPAGDLPLSTDSHNGTTHEERGDGRSIQAEAGPSSPRSHRPQLQLTTSRDSDNEIALLDQAIHSKRRKSSFLPGIHLHHSTHADKQRKRKDSAGAESNHGVDVHESPESIVPTLPPVSDRNDGQSVEQTTRSIEGRDEGPVVPDISDDTETDEARANEEELTRTLEADRIAQETMPARGKIALLQGSKGKGKEPEVWRGFEERDETDLEYVWEILYENQRGLYIFGKAYFSPAALLPADPSPYTLPIERLPAASSKFLLSNPEGDTTIVHSSEDKAAQPRRRNIKTAYTPETFQLPSPSWEWLNPWMINMRTGTDEMGWRYNAWFKQKGWRSKAGSAGWGGWVRRREWVRLRRAVPDDGKDEEDTRPKIAEESVEKRKRGGLGQVMESDDGLLAIVKEVETVLLDREKLEMWEHWLGSIDDRAKDRLQEMLEDPQSRRTLYRQFMYRSTTKRFTSLLVEHDLSIPDSATAHSSRTTSPSPSQQGYDI